MLPTLNVFFFAQKLYYLWCKKTKKSYESSVFLYRQNYIVGVILWDAISPHFSLSNSLLKLNSDRLSCVWGATRLHSGLKTIMRNYFRSYFSMLWDIPSILVSANIKSTRIFLWHSQNKCNFSILIIHQTRFSSVKSGKY